MIATIFVARMRSFGVIEAPRVHSLVALTPPRSSLGTPLPRAGEGTGVRAAAAPNC
jgi:hypothetical protein